MLRHVTITPDSKDWTWVLQRACPECGFDTASFAREAVPSMIRDVAQNWHAVLASAGDHRQRRRPDQWSALEYGCHVRDVFRLYDHRLDLMLIQDGPHYPNWDQDETAIEARYAEQDPGRVADELVAAAAAIAASFEQVAGDQWQRTGFRSDGAQFTVESFARYFIHDPVHHYYDVTGSKVSAG
jgi:hypothetical protein